MDAYGWAREIAENLQIEFGGGIAFLGLQGSRAQGEAHEGSNIDAVVLLDEVTADDLVRYRSIVGSMECSEFACGFVGSGSTLVAWPRHELFQFYNDTVPVFGSLPDVGPFTRDDALQAARIGASGIYHAACHAYVFEASAAPDVLKPLFKGAFYVHQATQFARMGVYPRTKAELSELLGGDEALILKTGCSWDSRPPVGERETRSLVDLLIGWVRLDARGNKEGVDAQFSLDGEKLAYHIRPEYEERDFNDNHADADSELMRLIAESDDILAVSSDAVLDCRIRSL